MRGRRVVQVFLMAVFAVTLVVGASAEPRLRIDAATRPVAEMLAGAQRIDWMPRVEYAEIVLTVVGPNDFQFRKSFEAGTAPRFELMGDQPDGTYTYELRATAPGPKKIRNADEQTAVTSPATLARALVQSGFFTILNGGVVPPDISEPTRQRPPGTTTPSVTAQGIGSIDIMDVVHADDVIITGSACVGFDCLTDGTENFGFDTIKMKENNLQIYFDDTSTTVGFPANDWRFIANDSSSGGGNYFAIQDSTGAKTPFRIEAGARTNALYVSSGGRVGIGTATPVLHLHMLYGDTPSFRLDQDTSSGWTAQVWDIAGNESNFFIRDTTGGSKLPFRIQPGTPTNTLTLKSDGKVGIGTWAPAYKVEVETTGENCAIVTDRTDGATNFMNATASYAQFGAVTNHPVRILVNSTWRMMINPDGSLNMSNGASLTAGGQWLNSSSIELKDNIDCLSPDEAAAALSKLNPVKYSYKADRTERHVGFIAEEVPDLVATKDRKSLSPMDIVAVLTKVVQEQSRTIETQDARIEALERQVQVLVKQRLAEVPAQAHTD